MVLAAAAPATASDLRVQAAAREQAQMEVQRRYDCACGQRLVTRFEPDRRFYVRTGSGRYDLREINWCTKCQTFLHADEWWADPAARALAKLESAAEKPRPIGAVLAEVLPLFEPAPEDAAAA